MRTRIGFGLMMVLTACGADNFAGDGGAHDDAGSDGGTVPVTGGDKPDGGAPEAAPPPPGCDVSKLPTEDACVVNDAEGVFASSSLGTATGDGTRAHPLVSLDAALALAKKSQKRVYACAETYAEQIHLQEGTNVFGYFTCSASWAIGAAHAAVRAPASPAAVASNIALPTRVEAVDIVSPDFADKSQSSIALLATASPGLLFKQATIHAGTGGKGDSGVDGIQLTDSGTAKNGASSWTDGVCTGTSCTFTLMLNTEEPAGGTNTCTGETGHNGGSGGSGGTGGEDLANGSPFYTWSAETPAVAVGNPTTATTQTAQGGTWGISGSGGAPGANGSDGTTGSALGVVSASGYVPSDGTSGASGLPGQGGGGGGGRDIAACGNYPASSYTGKYGWGEPGGGGGAGGCPGLASTSGKGGGASIAIVAVQSALTLDTVTVESSAGGAGGSAGAPSAPTSGGNAGSRYYYAGAGGNGGLGGNAGVSGNGGGGPSFAIAYQGTSPQLLASKSTQGPGGSGVAVRTVNSQTIPASPDGMSLASYSF